MTVRKKLIFLAAAFLSGVLISWMYVNPYGGRLPFSELVLQLSGSSGTFPLGRSLNELMSYSIRLIPSYIFECFFGIYFYQRFCTASVYIFSRYPNRVQWYMKEMAAIAVYSLLFYEINLLGAILTAGCRYQIVLDRAGGGLLLYHLLFYSLWTWSMCMIINLLALYTGSQRAFSIVIGGQAVLTAALSFGNGGHTAVSSLLIRMNPMAHLVLGWHAGGFLAEQWETEPVDWTLSFVGSLGLFLIAAVFIVIGGCCLIRKYELLVENMEMGVY